MDDKKGAWKSLVALAVVWVLMAVVPHEAIKVMDLTDRLITLGAFCVVAVQAWRWAR